MKFSKKSQLGLVAIVGLTVATWLTGCEIVTADYLFVASNTTSSSSTDGKIETYAIDANSGALRTASSIVDSGAAEPSSLAVSPDYKYLFAGHTGSGSTGAVSSFTISTNGVLSKIGTVSITEPVKSVVVNAAGTYLYILSGSTTVTLREYAITSGKIADTATATETISRGTDTVIPAGVVILANSSAVFAAVADTTTGNGYVYGFNVGSGGALTTISGSPYSAGVRPSAIATDPASRFVYVTDYASSTLIGYRLLTNNVLYYLTSGPYSVGKEPTSVTVDPRGRFIYVANSLDATVSAFEITTDTGVPSAVTSTTSTTNPTDTNPVGITVEPAYGRYVFTANSIGNSVSGFRLNSTSGALSTAQATPYQVCTSSNANCSTPAALVAVPHGNHAAVTPVN